MSRRTWLLAIFLLLGLVYVGTTVMADFIARLGQYEPRYYEPKDFSRERSGVEAEKKER